MHVEMVLLLCVCCARRVTAYPNGQVQDSCQSMTPSHTDFQSQISRSPYKVSVNRTTFTPGQTITDVENRLTLRLSKMYEFASARDLLQLMGAVRTRVQPAVTLQAAENAYEFQGFMLQAREVDGTTAVGRFTSININQSRALNCFDTENSTLSQASADRKSQFEATWEAPANSSLGDIQFFATFVRDYTSFWTMVNSSKIRSTGNQPSTTIKPAAASQQTSFLPNSSLNRYLSAMWLILILHALILPSLLLSINL